MTVVSPTILAATTTRILRQLRHDPRTVGLLVAVGSSCTAAELKAIYTKLDTIYREGIPVVPLMYRPNEFYEYNASNWTNFPDEKNPYAPPGWAGASIGWIFGLKRVGG